MQSDLSLSTIFYMDLIDIDSIVSKNCGNRTGTNYISRNGDAVPMSLSGLDSTDINQF